MLPNHQNAFQYDAIVIGAGISGLTTSLILAKEGKKVALFERDQDIAPLIRPYQRKDCQFSPGLHISGWMADGEVISCFMKYLNIADGVEKVRIKDRFVTVDMGLNQYNIPIGLNQVEESLLSYFPESAAAVRNYMDLVKEINEQSFYFNHHLTPDSSTNHDFFGPGDYTLKDCLTQHHASQELINMLDTLNYILVGSKADEVSMTIHAFVLGGFYRSAGFFTVKGINRLLANIKRELAVYGVNLFLDSEVDQIIIGNNRNAAGIKIRTGEQYFAATIVASFNPKLLNETVKDTSLRPVYRRRLVEAENTVGMYVAFYQFNTDKDTKIENLVYYNNRLDITFGVTTNHDNGHNILCVFLPELDQAIPAEASERKNRAERNLALLEQIVDEKFPELNGKIVLLDYLKPWSFERYTQTVNGSAYGIKQTLHSIGFQHRVPIHGLYLVGQAIYPGFLGSMISGFSLACELFEAKKFWPGVISQ